MINLQNGSSYTRTDGVPNGRRRRAADENPTASANADADGITLLTTLAPLANGPLMARGAIAMTREESTVEVVDERRRVAEATPPRSRASSAPPVAGSSHRDLSPASAMPTAGLHVNATVALQIASAYLDSPTSRSPLVEAAYAQLAVETDRLFAALTSPGRADSVRVRFSTCAQPYDTAEELIASVRRHRLVEITAARTDRYRKHPVFDCAVGGTFDRFRAVHDILGHARLGAGFDRHGEYATWRYQERFHTALARQALATELHAKHSACWTTGESPDHKTLLVHPRLLRHSRGEGVRPRNEPVTDARTEALHGGDSKPES